jgi:Ca2+-binding EF-hand superfamily protein
LSVLVLRGALSNQAQEQQVNQLFEAIDTDQSGFVSIDELGAFMQSKDPSVTVEHVQERFDQLDRNRDGSLSLQEFLGANTVDLGVHGTTGENGKIHLGYEMNLS